MRKLAIVNYELESFLSRQFMIYKFTTIEQ
jgi:hypothetical protein